MNKKTIEELTKQVDIFICTVIRINNDIMKIREESHEDLMELMHQAWYDVINALSLLESKLNDIRNFIGIIDNSKKGKKK